MTRIKKGTLKQNENKQTTKDKNIRMMRTVKMKYKIRQKSERVDGAVLGLTWSIGERRQLHFRQINP